MADEAFALTGESIETMKLELNVVLAKLLLPASFAEARMFEQAHKFSEVAKQFQGGRHSL